MTISPDDHEDVPELTLGWRIQMALQRGNLKHADLMAKFEVSRETVSRWCRDHGAAPKKFILNEIAVMCGVSPRWLITGEDPHDTPPPTNSDPNHRLIPGIAATVTALFPSGHDSAA